MSVFRSVQKYFANHWTFFLVSLHICLRKVLIYFVRGYNQKHPGEEDLFPFKTPFLLLSKISIGGLTLKLKANQLHQSILEIFKTKKLIYIVVLTATSMESSRCKEGGGG